MSTTMWNGRRRFVAMVGAGAALALALSGCSRADVADDTDDDSGVPVGASAEEYQEALADMEEVTLVYQVRAASADSPDAVPEVAFTDFIEEYSGGKITFEMAWANGIESNVVEADKALSDGRLDISAYWPQYKPSEYPVNNLLIDATVLRAGEITPGYFAIAGAAAQSAIETPEVMAEFTNQGITPLTPVSPDGPPVLVCREELTSLADLAGKQIRSGGTANSRQIEALGAVPISMPYPEVYEALQRGILDCALEGHAIATLGGHLEVAPWVIHPTAASFASTPTNLYAGPKYKTLPAAAQQLIVEAALLRASIRIEDGLARIGEETITQAEEYGGGFLTFDPEVDAKLSEVNDEILDDIVASDLFDGEAFVKRMTANNDAWNEKVAELGYADGGDVEEYADWFAPVDGEAWIDAMNEITIAPRFAKE